MALPADVRVHVRYVQITLHGKYNAGNTCIPHKSQWTETFGYVKRVNSLQR